MRTESSYFDLSGYAGTNESERLLMKLCHRSFLRLWAHANLFTDEGLRANKGSTKELTDALVVFGDDVVIFSDKHIAFQHEQPLEVAWPRWYRRAVSASIKQLRGAKSWLVRFPYRVYLDPQCTRRLPVAVPTGSSVRFHLVAVTRGSRDAAQRFNGGYGRGSFRIATNIVGQEHLRCPFTLGTPEAQKDFVHVFDEATIELLMQELDTAADFIAYLKRRESLLGVPGRVVLAQGEEDLLAAYLRTMDRSGTEHCFHQPDEEFDTLIFDDTHFETLLESPEYVRKKQADMPSYFWDALIDKFIDLGDPSVSPPELVQGPADVELGLRYLAGESRFRRRILANSLKGALEQARDNNVRMARLIYDPDKPGPVFVFLVVPKRDDESHEEYRRYRIALLHAYCRIAKLQATKGTIFVGLAFDHPNRNYRLVAEDLLVWSQSVWTDEEIRELERMRDKLKLFGPNMLLTRFSETEFSQISLNEEEILKRRALGAWKHGRARKQKRRFGPLPKRVNKKR